MPRKLNYNKCFIVPRFLNKQINKCIAITTKNQKDKQSNYKINNEMRLESLTEENRNNTNFLGLRLGITFGLRL